MTNRVNLPETLAEGRPLLAIDVPAAKRKQLGQCFTGLLTGRLLAALAVSPGQRRIVDPMAGHGDLLEAAAERAGRLHWATEELRGVEIEPEAARLGKWRVERCVREFGVPRGSFVKGDAFDSNLWETSSRFDLVITNPPYVRYQTLTKGGKNGGVKLLNAQATRQALDRLAVKLAPPEEQFIWRRLISSYSGLADLSVPSWLLCGLLTAPSGTLALVVPQTWLNRDYARIARYFFLRFFRPVAVVQESGQRWFGDAQVPVSLVVGRRLSLEEILTPLRDRRNCNKLTPFVEISTAASSPRSRVGEAFPGDDPEGKFAKWLEGGAGARPGVSLKRVSWESQRDEVLAASRNAEWLRGFEGDAATGTAEVPSSSVLPASVIQHLPADYLTNLHPLSAEPIRIGQGLRTGCNAFFYVELAADHTEGDLVPVWTHELFGRKRIEVPSRALRPVLRRQGELSNLQISVEKLHGRLLDLREFVLPENASRRGLARARKSHVMPKALAEHVRLAAKTYLVRGETKTLIPLLSAVKPNGRGPGYEATSVSLPDAGPVRMWYMIPDFAPRHQAELCVPRIIHDKPEAVLNSRSRVLIDANFSTLWCEGNGWSAPAVFAILNSTWGELCMEALGATLGGGALKLEATHLRQLPIPAFSDSEKQSLQEVVNKAMAAKCPLEDFPPYRAKIDHIVISALSKRRVSAREAVVATEKLEAIIHSLRRKRRRNQAAGKTGRSMKIFAQNSRCPSQVLFAFDEVADVSVEKVRWAVAYSTKLGCERLVNRISARMTESRWKACEKHFITSLDFGLTDPGALEFLSSLPASKVYIANPEIVGQPGLLPRHAYHPKLYLFDAAKTTGYVVGSANLTASALIANTEVVVAGKETPGNCGWNDLWSELLFNTAPLTTALLDTYRRNWVRPQRRPVEPDPTPLPPAIIPGNNPVFWDAVASGEVSPRHFNHLWIEAGSMSSEGSHNQLELPRGGNRFFGFDHAVYGEAHVTIGYPALTLRGRRWTNRPLTWHGHNKMERINLPTRAQGGFDYRQTAVLFRRQEAGFEINVLPWGDDGAVAWRAASDSLHTVFRLGARGQRICGLF